MRHRPLFVAYFLFSSVSSLVQAQISEAPDAFLEVDYSPQDWEVTLSGDQQRRDPIDGQQTLLLISKAEIATISLSAEALGQVRLFIPEFDTGSVGVSLVCGTDVQDIPVKIGVWYSLFYGGCDEGKSIMVITAVASQPDQLLPLVRIGGAGIIRPHPDAQSDEGPAQRI